LQRDIGSQLLDRYWQQPDFAGIVLDIGSGTGFCTEEVLRRSPRCRVLALDISDVMLRQARHRIAPSAPPFFVCGDAESLPFSTNAVDLIVSNLAFQWCPDLEQLLRGISRVLRTGGMLCFSTFGPNTLSELREAWASVDHDPHVSDFVGPDRLRSALTTGGFRQIGLESELRSRKYSGAASLMRELKNLGAHNATAGRARHLTGKSRFQKMLAAYPGQTDANGVLATFEIVYGCAILA
jgi:malonyl-CoA O-methyltransferase